MAEIYVDNIPASSIVAGSSGNGSKVPGAGATGGKDNFWATPPLPISDPSRDIMTITLNNQRLVNYIYVETAHFPHCITVEFQDPDTGLWNPLLHNSGEILTYMVSDSSPKKVNTQGFDPTQHPQHQGSDHWIPITWEPAAIQVKRIRFNLQRSIVNNGSPPTDVNGTPAAYSLGLRNVEVGYRINSKADIPRYGDVDVYKQDFASTTDILGSRVVFSMSEDKPGNTIDPDSGNVWRSDPQPVNYAVVNFYSDTRTLNGNGQVIDKFFIDPMTVGAHMNVYYSNDDPETDFEASDEPLNYPIMQQHGTTATPLQFPQDLTPTAIEFSHVYESYVDIDNTFLQFKPDKAWWMGLQILSAYTNPNGTNEVTTEPTAHPILSFGRSTLETVPDIGDGTPGVQFTNGVDENPFPANVPYDHGHHVGSIWNVVVIYNPPDAPLSDYPPGITMIYQLGSGVPNQITTAITLGPEMQQAPGLPDRLRIGGYFNNDNPGIPAFALRSFILKTKPAQADDINTFLSNAQSYVKRAPFETQDTGTTKNSILRCEPWRADTKDSLVNYSPVGLFGGPGDRYADLTWTPIFRDYKLKKGYLYIPPTKARYFKFEFTQLVAQSYNTFVPIKRKFKVFTTNTVLHYNEILGSGPSTPEQSAAGAQSHLDLATINQYADAINVLKSPPGGPSPAGALVSTNPRTAKQLSDNGGWVWSFQPWHSGSIAPSFILTQRHVYEEISVTHDTKVAYFAGLKNLIAYRLNYLTEDDTAEYVEHFLDMQHIEVINGALFAGDGRLIGLGGLGDAHSKTFTSTSGVRGVQFATQQSDSTQLLADDDFTKTLSAHWQSYGDATLTPSYGQVLVQRGWYARRYEGIEDPAGTFGTYGGMEQDLYGFLEGAEPDGSVGGGIRSLPITPSASGRLFAAVKVTAPNTLSSPIELDIISIETGDIIASSEEVLTAGETTTFYVTYSVGSASVPLTYLQAEAYTYAQLDATTYDNHESRPIAGDIYVRALQTGPSQDQFTIEKLSLFQAPMTWSFSNDGGTTWYEAIGVRNNPDGVLTFPDTTGTELKWRVQLFNPGATISALAIRPWYHGYLGAKPGNSGFTTLGPNTSVIDTYPAIENDPMWQQWDQPIPRGWYVDNPATVAIREAIALGTILDPTTQTDEPGSEDGGGGGQTGGGGGPVINPGDFYRDDYTDIYSPGLVSTGGSGGDNTYNSNTYRSNKYDKSGS